jgi:hypothetical protein
MFFVVMRDQGDVLSGFYVNAPSALLIGNVVGTGLVPVLGEGLNESMRTGARPVPTTLPSRLCDS